jgi:hypothetical protein
MVKIQAKGELICKPDKVYTTMDPSFAKGTYAICKRTDGTLYMKEIK